MYVYERFQVGVDGSTIAAAPAEGLRTSLEKAGVVLKSMAPNENPVRAFVLT